MPYYAIDPTVAPFPTFCVTAEQNTDREYQAPLKGILQAVGHALHASRPDFATVPEAALRTLGVSYIPGSVTTYEVEGDGPFDATGMIVLATGDAIGDTIVCWTRPKDTNQPRHVPAATSSATSRPPHRLEKYTVANLIAELRKLPQHALVVLSTDAEGNQYNYLESYNPTLKCRPLYYPNGDEKGEADIPLQGDLPAENWALGLKTEDVSGPEFTECVILYPYD